MRLKRKDPRQLELARVSGCFVLWRFGLRGPEVAQPDSAIDSARFAGAAFFQITDGGDMHAGSCCDGRQRPVRGLEISDRLLRPCLHEARSYGIP